MVQPALSSVRCFLMGFTRGGTRALNRTTLAENASVCPRTPRAEGVRVGPVLRLPLGDLATGIYTVRVSDGSTSKAQKLIVH